MVGGFFDPMNIQEIRNRIEGDSADSRFEAWALLYSSLEPEASQEMESIMTGSDPILKILLARFLSRVYEDKAVEYLCRMLCDTNSVVIDIVIRCFEKNLYEAKLPKLLAVLNAPVYKAQSFAIEKLCLGNVPEILDPLLTLLKAAHNQLLEHILSCLRHLPDKRLMSVAKKFLIHESQKVRFHAIMVLGSLYETGHGECRKYLVAALKDPHPRIRQAILWVFRKISTRSDLKYFLCFSRQDPDSNVRQEALLGLAAFPISRVVQHLLKLLVSDEDRMVILKGEAVLLSIPQKKLIRGLKKVLKDREFAVKSKAVVMFSELHPALSQGYHVFLMKEIRAARSTREKIPFIQSLGIAGFAEAIPYLQEQTHSPDQVLSYTAMVALLKIYSRSISFPILEILRDELLSDLLKQMAMKYFIKVADRSQLTRELMVFLLDYLGSPCINLRYLAVRVLIASEDDRFLEPLFGMIIAETDPSIKQLLREYMIQAIAKNSLLFLKISKLFCLHRQPMTTLFAFFDEAFLQRESVRQFVKNCFDPAYAELLSLFPHEFAHIFQKLLKHHDVTLVQLMDLMDTVPQNSILLEELQRLLETGTQLNPVVTRGDWHRWVYESKELDRVSLVRLMRLVPNHDTLGMLMGILADPAQSTLHETARLALRQRIGLAA